MTPTVAAPPRFDLDSPWTLASSVSVRPEPFGALLYDFATRRLSFVKDTRLRTVVVELAEHPSARAACLAAGVGHAELPDFERALARLAGSGILRPQQDRPDPVVVQRGAPA